MTKSESCSQALPDRVIVILIAFLVALMTATGPSRVCGESCADRNTPQTIILDHFEAKDAAVSDVLEALTLRVENLTNRSYQPNFVITGGDIGSKLISLHLQNAPLSEALDRIGDLPGVRVTYAENSTVFFSPES
jgi:hypothetical protein